MKYRSLVVIVLLAALLTACIPNSTLVQNATKEIPSNYTSLPVPDSVRVSLYRSVEDNIVCYYLWGGVGVGVSCPSTPKKFEEDLSKITITDLGIPNGILHAEVYKIKDGDQVCFLSVGGTDVSLSCP